MGRHTLNRLHPTEFHKETKRGYYADGGGLHFRVSAFGTRSWVFRYTRDSKAREMGLGSYPDVTLKEARKKAAEARELLRDNADPIDHRKAAKSASLAERMAALTFEECALAFIAVRSAEWKSSKHAMQWASTLQSYAYPVIGKMLIQDVTQAHVLKILNPIWEIKTETASRLRGRIESVLDYATARGYRKGDNPARWKGLLDKLLPKPSKVTKVAHHAALPYQETGLFMADLRKQPGMGARTLEFAILTATRSGEVRGATWGEFDLQAAIWIIPATRMKAGKEHRVPLSPAALNLLKAMPRVAGSEYIFPNTKGGALSDMTLTAVLRRMNAGITAHGFRSTFRDWAGETTAYPREVIEHALAHQLKDATEAAYARGTLFDKRRRLMDDWARHCLMVTSTATVTPINSAQGAA